MVQRFAIALALFGFCCVASISAANAATAGTPGDARCVYPDPYDLVGRNFVGLEKVDYRLFDTRNGPLRWVFLSWEGPPDGWVFVLACDGHVIAKRGLGYVDQLSYGPSVGGDMTIEARYVPASGTGLNLQSVALLQFDGKTISLLWDHASKNTSAFPSRLWGGRPDDDRLRAEIDAYEWHYLDGTEIRVSGMHTVELGDTTTRHVLPPERYCFQSALNKFSLCR